MTQIRCNQILVYLTVFIVGFVILCLEIVGTRIIAPYYGNTIYVWSALISTVILGLALGYFIGGILADRYPRPKTLAALLFLTALMTIVIPWIDGYILKASTTLGIRFGALVSALTIFTLPFTLFGMITPLAVKLSVNDLKNVGSITGRLYAISSVGCFAGVVVTGFVLVPAFGIKSIVMGVSGVLVLVACIWFDRSERIAAAAVLIVALSATYFLPQTKLENLLFEKQSLMGRVQVIDRFPHRILMVEGSPQSWVKKGSFDSSASFTQTARNVYFMRPNMKDVLIIGLGAGASSNDLEKMFNLNVEAVEIDPQVVQVARKYFDFQGEAYIDDGRHFVRTSAKKYDAIILDMTVGDGAPVHFFTREAFAEFKGALNKDGVIVLHMVGGEDVRARSVYKTLDQVFANVNFLKRGQDFTTTVVYFATDGVIDKEQMTKQMYSSLESDGLAMTYENVLSKSWQEHMDGGIVITDDYNPLDLWQAESMEAWRQYSIEEFGQYLSI